MHNSRLSVSETPSFQTLSSSGSNVAALSRISTARPENFLVAVSQTNADLLCSTEVHNDNIPIGPGVSAMSRLEIENQEPPISQDVLIEVEPLNEKGPYKCQDCPEVFLKWPHFKRHKAEHLDAKSFRCSLCPMSFNFEINLTLHEMIHEAEISECLECRVCPAKFSRLASLRSHVRVHEREENLVCPECGDEFATKARLDNHVEEHKTLKSLVLSCKLCGKTFTHAGQLKEHSKEHSAVRTQLKLLSSRRKRPAKRRQKNADEEEGSSVEKSKHSNKKKLNCSVCNKGFEKPSQLTRHMRIHTGEKPYSCNQCGKSFNQKNTLESHILSTHEKLKPHTCHLCNCQFSQRGNLRAHVIKVHVHPGNGEHVFKCDECSCVFRKLATLNSHVTKLHSKKTETPVIISQPQLIVSQLYQTSSLNSDVDEVVSNASFMGQSSYALTLPIIEELNEKASRNAFKMVSHNTTPIPNSNSALTQISEIKVVHQARGKPTTIIVKRDGQFKWHMCPYDCDKSFKKPSDLIRHIRIHTQERPFECTTCKKSFAVKSTLITHIKTHTHQKDWVCGVCGRRFAVLTSLRAHERLHTGAKPFPCLTCGKCFRTSSQRKLHSRQHTRNTHGLSGKRKLLRIGDIEPKIDLPDPLKITSDGLVPVPNRTALNAVQHHSVQEMKSRPFHCNVCPSAFKKSSHLKQHQRSHTGERPYKCFQCFRSFISSGVLKNHIKTHEGVRAFRCNLCPLSFTTNGSLTRHKATHNDERSFVCPYCHKTFKTSVACRKHIRIHRNEFVALHTRGDADLEQVQTNNVGYVDQQPNTETFVNLQSADDIYDDFASFSRAENQMQIANGHEADTHALLDQEHSTTMSSLQEQIHHITNLISGDPQIENVDVSNTGLQYSLPRETTMEEVVNQLTEGQSFDCSMFTLQGTDTIELSILPSNQTSNNYSEQQTDEHEMQTIQSFEQHHQNNSTVATESVISTSNYPDHEKEPNINPAEISNVEEAVVSFISESDADNTELNRIRESSRPISQLIYDEIQLRKNKEEFIVADDIPPSLSDLEKGKVNVCNQCGRGFKKRSDLIRHTRIHTGEKPFRCSVDKCGKAFRVKSTMESHMRTHEGGKTVACHVCNNLFSTKSSLRVHLRLHTGSRPYKCPHCERCFRTSGHRKAHVVSHFKQPKNAKLQPAVTSTVSEITNTTILPPVETIKENCNQQGLNETTHTIYTTTSLPGMTSDSLNDQVQIIGSLQVSLDPSQMQNIQLDLSGLQLSEELLQSLGNVIFVTPNHQLLTTGEMPEVILGTTGISLHGHSESETHQSIINHQELEANNKALTGKDVNVNISAGNLLSQQVVSITDMDTLIPTETNLMGFSNFNPATTTIINSPMLSSTSAVALSSSLKQTPTYVEVFSNKQCTICRKTFAKPSLLTRHMSVHTGVKPFKCDQCSSTFNQKNSLEIHKYTHGTERPFVCSICPFKTVVKASLKKHISRAHPTSNIDEMLNSSIK